MNQTVNETYIKLSSKVPSPGNLSLGDDITVLINYRQYIFNVVKQEINDLQDGTVNVTYVCKSTLE